MTVPKDLYVLVLAFLACTLVLAFLARPGNSAEHEGHRQVPGFANQMADQPWKARSYEAEYFGVANPSKVLAALLVTFRPTAIQRPRGQGFFSTAIPLRGRAGVTMTAGTRIVAPPIIGSPRGVSTANFDAETPAKEASKEKQDRLLNFEPWWANSAGYFTNVVRIGRGEFGKVYSMDLTCPPAKATKVAMKELCPSKMDQELIDEEMEAMRDLSMLLRLNATQRKSIIGDTDDYSPYCSPLLGEPKKQDGCIYVPIPFYNKGTFKDIYRDPSKRAKFGDDRGMYALLLHVAKGVKALHAAGWVHNDIHGGNVLISASSDKPDRRFAGLIDLGLACKTNRKKCGTRGYTYVVSPEVASYGNVGHFPNPKSDVWQLGMMLWEIRFGACKWPSMPANMEEASEKERKEAAEAIIPTLDFKNEPFDELKGEPLIQNLLRGTLTKDVSDRWDVDKVIAELEKAALPAMIGPHSLRCGWSVSDETLAPADRKQRPYAIGATVQIDGCVRSPEKNGLIGTVVRYDDFNNGYEIKLIDDGRTELVRAAKLKFAPINDNTEIAYI